jgi:triosephosphate isomerase
MKGSNAHELLSHEDIDGGLIGGASLDPKALMEIVHAANQE